MTDTATFNIDAVGMLNTRLGLDVLSEGLLGKEILFTRVALGDGELAAESDEEYREKVLNLTELVNWKFDLPIAEMKNQGDGKVWLNAIKDNADIADGFFAREQAVFAKHPATGKEVLYSYRNSGDKSSYIPGNLGAVTKVINLGIYTVIQNAKNVNAIIDASFAYTSRTDFNSHVESEHPHPNTPNHFADVTNADHFWVTLNDNHLHKLSVDNARQILLDGTNADDDALRLLIAEKELGLECNVLMADELNPATELDEFTCKVVSCARGGRLIGIDTVDGIVKGAYYWIADGVNQELIQIAGVAYGTDYYRATLEVALTYDYNNAKLYRTTYHDKLVDKKYLKWIPRTVFNGIEANIERDVYADTTQANSAAVKIEGEGYMTQSGYMTLRKEFKGEYSSSTGNPGSETGGIIYEDITEADVDAVMRGEYDDRIDEND